MKEQEIKQEKKEIIEYSKTCPYCKTKIISMYPNQLSFNYRVHESTCEENPKNKEAKNEN